MPMHTTRLTLAAALIFITFHRGAAQVMYGAVLGNYAGVNSIQLNPSAMHNSKMYLDVQLMGFDVFLQNNYLYIPAAEYRFSNFFKTGYVWPSHTEEYGTEERNFYHYSNKRDKNAFFQSRINGPGAMLLYNRHAFALTTAVRTIVSADKIPDDLANFMYLGLNYEPQQDIRYTDYGPVTVSGMAWGELGLSYSNVVYARDFTRIAAGITVKRLFGLGGMYVNVKQVDYIVPDDSTLDIRNLDAEMGLSIPVDYNTNDILASPVFKGGGFGIDLGVTYTRFAKYHTEQYFDQLCARPYEDYKFRLGVALIDLGGIRFRNNATRMRIDNRSAYWTNVNRMDYQSVGQLLDTLSYMFYGDTVSAYTGNRFTLWLPSALSLQFDYHFRKNWYFNASLIQGFAVAKGAIARPAELTITPRYETDWFEASLPVSLYHWQLARIGLAVRVFGVTVGTDKLGGFFHISDFTGLDFYMSVKFFLDKGKCRTRGPVHCGGNEPKRIRF